MVNSLATIEFIYSNYWKNIFTHYYSLNNIKMLSFVKNKIFQLFDETVFPEFLWFWLRWLKNADKLLRKEKVGRIKGENTSVWERKRKIQEQERKILAAGDVLLPLWAGKLR